MGRKGGEMKIFRFLYNVDGGILSALPVSFEANNLGEALDELQRFLFKLPEHFETLTLDPHVEIMEDGDPYYVSIPEVSPFDQIIKREG